MKKFSGFLSLNARDWLNGLFVSIFGAVLAIVQTSITEEAFSIDLDQLWKTALKAGLAYIAYKLSSPIPKVVAIDPTKTAVVDVTNKEVISETSTAPAKV